MEIMDIVNEQDEVIGNAPRNEIYGKKLCHRIAHVIVFNEDKEMALQLRSKTVSYRPHHWVTTAGGHVKSGESYKDAAIRETEEEVGFIPTALTLLGKNDYIDNEQCIPKKLAIFTTTHTGIIEGNPKDVERIAFFPLDQIQHLLQGDEKIHPELRFILKEYYSIV